MNIENFDPIIYSFKEIFEKQKEIKFLYEPESKDIFENFDIDTFEDQEIFKKYCWRITEELMEALEDISNKKHFREEIIDSFNFMIELYLLCGYSYELLGHIPTRNKIEVKGDPIANIIYQLGITANLLKNRQWRQSQYLVDMHLFTPRFEKIWECFFDLFYSIDLSNDEIRALWSLKYQVNLFRINSNY